MGHPKQWTHAAAKSGFEDEGLQKGAVAGLPNHRPHLAHGIVAAGSGPGGRGRVVRYGVGVRVGVIGRVQPPEGQDRSGRGDGPCEDVWVLHPHPGRQHTAVGTPKGHHGALLQAEYTKCSKLNTMWLKINF
eukprot:scaffold312483_cov28-Prasinocladus_malaysianus.AAC.1